MLCLTNWSLRFETLVASLRNLRTQSSVCFLSSTRVRTPPQVHSPEAPSHSALSVFALLQEIAVTDAHAKQAHAHLPPESKAVSTRTIRARAMERAPVSSVSKVSNEGAPATAGYQRFHRPAVAISCFC